MRALFVVKALLLLCITSLSYSTEKATEPPQKTVVGGPSDPFSIEWSSLREKKQVKEWIVSLSDNMDAIHSDEHINKLSWLGLFELKGENNRFNRKTSSVRQLLEKNIVDDVERALNGQSKETPVRVLVLQPLGYLQEVFVLGKLLKEGRTNVEFIFVEKYYDKASSMGLQELQKALADEGIILGVNRLTSLKELPKKLAEPFHVGYSFVHVLNELTFEAIDSVLSARKLIDTKGKFYFSQLDGTIALSANSGTQVVEMTKKAQIACDTITATQLTNHAKDRTCKIHTETTDPKFFIGPLFYSTATLLKNGFTDLFLTAHNTAQIDDYCRGVISNLYNSLNSPADSSSLVFQWKKTTYVGDKIEFRKDLFVLWFDNLNIQDIFTDINREIILSSSSLPERGHWIICGKDIGLWVIDGKKNISAVDVPSDKQQLATVMVHDLFSNGSPWYK